MYALFREFRVRRNPLWTAKFARMAQMITLVVATLDPRDIARCLEQNGKLVTENGESSLRRKTEYKFRH